MEKLENKELNALNKALSANTFPEGSVVKSLDESLFEEVTDRDIAFWKSITINNLRIPRKKKKKMNFLEQHDWKVKQASKHNSKL